MIPGNVQGATHLFAKPTNWNEADGTCGDLYVRAETFGESNVVRLVSAWKPSPAELAHLNRGGVIEVGICAKTQPAMCVSVADEHESRGPSLTINEEAHGHG
jgi:hypothetical protein